MVLDGLAYTCPMPHMQELEKHPIRDPQRDDYDARREYRATKLRELHHLRYLPGPIPDQVGEEDRKIPVRDGAEITVRIYRPKEEAAVAAAQGRRPLVVMFHEGGWSMGDLTDEEVNCRLFCQRPGCCVRYVDYTGLRRNAPFRHGLTTLGMLCNGYAYQFLALFVLG